MAKGIPLDLACLMLAGLVVEVFLGLVPEIYFRFPAKSSHSPSVIFSVIYLPFRPKDAIALLQFLPVFETEYRYREKVAKLTHSAGPSAK